MATPNQNLNLDHGITPVELSRTGTNPNHSVRGVDEINKDREKVDIDHVEEATIGGGETDYGMNPHYTKEDAQHSVGLAIIDQVNAIPSAGERKVTHWKEYWSYILFGKSLSPSCSVRVHETRGSADESLAIGAHGIGSSP